MSGNNGLQLDHELQQKVREFARAHGVAEDRVVNEAVQEYLQSRKGRTLYDAFHEAGLIGCIDDANLPTDLSSNKKHFEGFGRE